MMTGLTVSNIEIETLNNTTLNSRPLNNQPTSELVGCSRIHDSLANDCTKFEYTIRIDYSISKRV